MTGRMGRQCYRRGVSEGDSQEQSEASWPEECRNCEAQLHGPFCSSCGESHRYARLELGAIVDEVLDGLLNLDTRFLRTVGELSVAPARVCREYIEGRRVRYIHPFKYAVATFTFAFLLMSAVIQLQGIEQSELSTFQMRWGQLINFLIMPALAGALWLLFWSREQRLNWVEHYVVVLYGFGHVALIQGLLNPFIIRFGLPAWVPSAVWFGYMSWLAAGVYAVRWWTAIPRMLVGLFVIQALSGGVLYLIKPELFT